MERGKSAAALFPRQDAPPPHDQSPLQKPHAVRPSRRIPTANDRTAIWKCTETKYQRPANKPKKLISQQGKNKRKVNFKRARSRETKKSQEPKTLSSRRLARARWSESRKNNPKRAKFQEHCLPTFSWFRSSGLERTRFGRQTGQCTALNYLRCYDRIVFQDLLLQHSSSEKPRIKKTGWKLEGKCLSLFQVPAHLLDGCPARILLWSNVWVRAFMYACVGMRMHAQASCVRMRSHACATRAL